MADYYAEEVHIPTFNGHGMALVGDYTVLRRRQEPHGFPEVFVSSTAVAEFLLRQLNKAGTVGIDFSWRRGLDGRIVPDPPMLDIVKTLAVDVDQQLRHKPQSSTELLILRRFFKRIKREVGLR